MANPPLSNHLALDAVNAVEIYGSIHAAARGLNIPINTFRNRIDVAKRRGIGSTTQQIETLHGHNPEHDLTHIVPSPLVLRGTSSLYKDGELKLQWVKTKLDDLKVEEALRAAVDALANDIPRAKPVTKPTHNISSLCNLYTFTDCHIGMRAWKPEAGDDWDLSIAEDMLTKAFDYLVEASPPAESCVINQLGDFLHFDSLVPETPTSGHSLDVDSRYSKVVKVAVRVLRYIINKSLTRHSVVKVLIAEGNHDLASSVWLRHLFSLLYEKEHRVSVIESEMPYYVYQHGKTMLSFHHGHLKKNGGLPLLFAAQFPVEWGNSLHRYCHTGHCHHYDDKEHSGMRVIQHSTLASRDAYASRCGWVAQRQITAITYHNEYGQVATITATPDMLT